MKHFLIVIGILATTSLQAATLVDETFTATFSDYKQFDNVVTCNPGYQGPYATADVITIRAHAIDTGLTISDNFTAHSHIGLVSDSHTVGGKRSYEAGCKPAMDKIRAAISGKEMVTVKVHRTVTSSINRNARVQRKVDGEVLRVNYLTTEQNYESLHFQLGELDFAAGQLQNGRTRAEQ